MYTVDFRGCILMRNCTFFTFDLIREYLSSSSLERKASGMNSPTRSIDLDLICTIYFLELHGNA